MEANTSDYQKKEADKNKSKAKSESFSTSSKEAPVQMIKKNKVDVSITEEEVEEAINDLNPDENSMDSRG